jgi:recombinational DNA repair protein (RecF pathway)
MNNCQICGMPSKDDLFSYVTQEKVCSICKIKFIGGLPTTQDRINSAREKLGLLDGDFLKQNNAQEAARILRRR